jgi:hypothetical protein
MSAPWRKLIDLLDAGKVEEVKKICVTRNKKHNRKCNDYVNKVKEENKTKK